MGGNSGVGSDMVRLFKITAHDQGDVVAAKREGTAHHANLPLRRNGLSGLSERKLWKRLDHFAIPVTLFATNYA